MDGVDRKILAVLQIDGRITLTELAARIHLSVSRCQRRVRELESSGVIRGYRAVVDPALTGLGFDVIIFATLDRASSVTDFETALVDVPEVIEAQRLFGEIDCLIHVVTPDLAAYQQLYDTVLNQLPGVVRLTSTIVLKHSVPSRPLPIRN